VLRTHSADIMFSRDKLSIFDQERNQLSVPLVRPEDEAVYKNLSTGPKRRTASMDLSTMRQATTAGETTRPGIIGRPSKLDTLTSLQSPVTQSPAGLTSGGAAEHGDSRRSDAGEPTPRSSTELTQSRPADDSKSTTGSEKSYSTPISKSSGAWGNSWRSTSTTGQGEPPKPTSSYSKPAATRTMKVLRPTKSLAGASRATSASSPSTNGPDSTSAKSEEPEGKPSATAPTRNNPVGSGSAFGWLNSGQQRRTTTNGN